MTLIEIADRCAELLDVAIVALAWRRAIMARKEPQCP